MLRGNEAPAIAHAPYTHVVQDFASKEDLLDACMASAHVPMVLDGRPFTSVRGRLYLDGSLQDFIVWDNGPLLKYEACCMRHCGWCHRQQRMQPVCGSVFHRSPCRCDGRAFILDYSQDEVLQAERFDFLRLRLYDEILQMIQLGFDYGQRIDAQGLLDKHLAPIKRG